MEIENEKVEYEMRMCKYEFDESELSNVARKLADKTQEADEVERQKKSAMATFKEKSEAIGSEIATAARLYKDGYEMRNIECVVERDFETGEVRYIRTDNGLVAHTSKMTMAERQRRIESMLPKEDEEMPDEKTDAEIRNEMNVQREMRSETSSF